MSLIDTAEDTAGITITVTAPTLEESAAVGAFIGAAMEQSGFESVSVLGAPESDGLAQESAAAAMRNLNPNIFGYDVTIDTTAADDATGDFPTGDDDLPE